MHQNENSGQSSSEVEATDVGGFLSNFVAFYYFSLILLFVCFIFSLLFFGPLGFVIFLFKFNNCSLRDLTFIHSIIF